MVYIFSFFLFLNFPIKVMFNKGIPFFYLFFFILAILLILNKVKLALSSISLNSLFISILLGAIFIVNEIYFMDPYYTKLMIGYFISMLILFLCMSISRDVYLNAKYKALILNVIVLANFMAVISNSIFHRYPNVKIGYQYYIGDYVRAGAGFLDPNYLSMLFITIILFIFFERKNLNLVNYLILLGMMFFCVAATFSRSALVTILFLLLIFSIIKLYEINLKGYLVFLFSIFCCLVIGYVFFDTISDNVLVDRVFSNEAQGSTDSRLYQWSVFIEYFHRYFGYRNIILGFGGQSLFVELAGISLHNYFMALIFDYGLLSFVLCLLLFSLTYFKLTNHSRLIFISTLLMMQFQHNVPDILFLILSFCFLYELNMKHQLNDVISEKLRGKE